MADDRNGLKLGHFSRLSSVKKLLNHYLVGGAKKASTSELLDWFKVLIRNGEDPAKDLLESKNSTYPYKSTLIKRLEDWDIKA